MQIIESFYVETQDGLFFAVKGLVHPPERIIGVVRYAPDPRGERNKDGKTYRRLYHFPEQEQLLRALYPQYLQHDPVFQTTLQSVPVSMVRRVYDPCSRIDELAGIAQAEEIVADSLIFTRILQHESGIPMSAIGVTGSLLIGLHKETSDLDLCVFGEQSSRSLCRVLKVLLNTESVKGLERLDARGIQELYRQRISDTRMSFQDFAQLERSKICQGNFRNRQYFIRFIKNPHETGEKYGDARYRAIGRANIVATVADDQDSIFTPCKYAVSEVRVLSGPNVAIDEIVSFRGRFCEQAKTGDVVTAAGIVEYVERDQGNALYRLMLGNSPEDTMTRVFR